MEEEKSPPNVHMPCKMKIGEWFGSETMIIINQKVLITQKKKKYKSSDAKNGFDFHFYLIRIIKDFIKILEILA